MDKKADQCEVERDCEECIRVVIKIEVFARRESVVVEHAKTKNIACGGSYHVKSQGKVTNEDFGANRAHHHCYFKDEACAPDKEFKRTRHVISSITPRPFEPA